MAMIIKTKRCSHCRFVLKTSEFGINRKNKDNRSHNCRLCTKDITLRAKIRRGAK